MTTLARALAALALALTGLVLAAPTPAFACRCQTGNVQEQVKQADVVFVGTVEEMAGVNRGKAFEYTVTAREAFKGQVERDVVVTSKASPAACGLGPLQAGTDYLFLASGDSPPYTATSCGGSAPASPSRLRKLEEAVGPATPVRSPQPETADRTTVEESPPGSFTRLAAPGAAIAIVGLLGVVVVRRVARR